MVNKCSAFGCKSGYKTNKLIDLQNEVTFHVFPLSDKKMCDKWIKANPRQDFVPNKNSRLCSFHFLPSDFVEERRDTNVTRRKSIGSAPRLRRQLKDDAVPSIFPNAPSYLSATKCKRRKTLKATSSSRHEQQVGQLEQLEQSFVASDDISLLTLAEVARKQQDETVPTGFTVTVMEKSLLIYLLDTQSVVTKISACIKIAEDFTVVVTLDDKVVPSSQYADLLKEKLQQLSQLVKVMGQEESLTGALASSQFLEGRTKLCSDRRSSLTQGHEGRRKL
jgi:hypothetical protein